MLEIIGSLIGGLGLLLVGMTLMTDGLRLASGNALRDILALWTNTRMRGLSSGFLITGIVQSSSAVTVATIGFANAGMLTLERAIWVIYGSNVGTTMTAWIVALLGFRVDIDALALPLVGLGALLKITGGYTKIASTGLAIIGFGLLFLGISFLQDTFANLGAEINLPVIEDPGVLALALYVFIGFVLTSLMQSSSAAMVITLSAAASGMVSLNTAAAIVIGANLGTTTTALLAVAGATSTAKRVAFGHVAFNLLTALVAIFILQPMIILVAWLEKSIGLASSPEITLALFHSAFNLLGVLLMWPLTASLTRFLQLRFVTSADLDAKPRHLDRTVLALPYIAIDALALEVSRVNVFTIAALSNSLRHHSGPTQLSEKQHVVQKLSEEIGYFSAELSRTPLTPFLSTALANLMESTQQYLLIIDIADDLTQLNHAPGQYLHDDINDALENFIASITRHLEIQDLSMPEHNVVGNASYEEVERFYRDLKDAILKIAAQGKLSMEAMDTLLQYANQAKRACRQTLKATQRLLLVRASLNRDFLGNVVTSEPSAS